MAGAAVLDVLPEQEYAEEHLPGAVNVPLRQLATWAAGAPDPHAAVIVYCYDTQ